MVRAPDWETVFEFWSVAHPADSEEEDGEGLGSGGDDPDELDTSPRIPTIDAIPLVVDYSDRAPGDWVIGGRLTPDAGTCDPWRRVFRTREEAFQWAVEKYGRQRVRLVRSDEEATRWVALIKKA